MAIEQIDLPSESYFAEQDRAFSTYMKANDSKFRESLGDERYADLLKLIQKIRKGPGLDNQEKGRFKLLAAISGFDYLRPAD